MVSPFRNHPAHLPRVRFVLQSPPLRGLDFQSHDRANILLQSHRIFVPRGSRANCLFEHQAVRNPDTEKEFPRGPSGRASHGRRRRSDPTRGRQLAGGRTRACVVAAQGRGSPAALGGPIHHIGGPPSSPDHESAPSQSEDRGLGSRLACVRSHALPGRWMTREEAAASASSRWAYCQYDWSRLAPGARSRSGEVIRAYQ